MDFSEPGRDVRQERIGIGVFAVLLLVHLWGVTAGWTSRSLPGNEFRQAQTAISALFIQREHNYSLAYPTPVLGAPWSIPFEFPLYQWAVVGISNVAKLPLIQSGRLVSVVCFYLSLPALWLLLGKVGIPRVGRWLVLGLTLSCPLYIFYTRAFLIETMALMFSIWFLYAFVVSVEKASVAWLIVANIAGALAGAVKVTTFLVYLIPAAIWAGCLLWQSRRSDPSSPPGGGFRMLGRIAAAVVVPFAATYAWLRYADAVKARNSLAVELTSENLRLFNFGTWLDRTEGHHWAGRWYLIHTELIGGVVVAALLAVFLIFARHRWNSVVAALFLFTAALLLFPKLYEIHGYYYAANGFFLLIAAGIVLTGVFESSAPRWLAWMIVVVFHVAQLRMFLGQHYGEQRYWTPGGTGLTDALKATTEPDDVLVIAGNDWSSVTPFFAERRAIMLRTGWENWSERVDEAFANLRGHTISAIVLHGPAATDERLRESLLNRFDADQFAPAFTWRDVTVYLPKRLRAAALALLTAHLPDGVTLDASEPVEAFTSNLREIAVEKLSAIEKRAFAEMSPAPVRVFATFGIGAEGVPGAFFYNAHPDSRLWFKPPPGRRHVVAGYRIVDAAWKDVPEAEATDGVLFRIAEVRADKTQRVLFERLVAPRDEAADRGLQVLNLDIDLAAGSELLFETTPGPARHYSRDWAGWGKIEIL